MPEVPVLLVLLVLLFLQFLLSCLMSNKFFWVLFSLILLISLFLHLHAISGNNYHFTVDQGNDAVHVRDLIDHPRILFRGPETSIRGVFAGPLWYYFLAIGYLATNGSPIGGLYLMIFLNLLSSAVWMVFLKNRIGMGSALLVGAARQITWPFFETGLYTFNPFPLVLLAAILIICLTKFLEGDKKYYVIALVAVMLSFNCDLAGAAVFLLFFLAVGVYALLKKQISTKFFLITGGIVPAVAVLAVLYDFYRVYLATRVSTNAVGGGLQVFSGTNFLEITNVFSEMISGALFPQNFYIGIILAAILLFLYFTKSSINSKTNTIIILVWVMFLISFLFFMSNKGYRSWHTIFHPAAIFTSFLLIIFTLPKKIRLIFLTIVLIANLLYFRERYSDHLNYSSDSSMLYNQLSVLDWIYTHNDEDGFNVYTYTDTFYDYPYQYLFWSYGRETYGFMPCEYANFPKAPKELYIPGYLRYTEPQLGCNRLRFLIIQSDTNGQTNKDWIQDFQKQTRLLEKYTIGYTTIEKRELLR